MSLLDNFPHTASAYIRTRTKEALGGGKDSFAAVSGFVGRACWFQPAGDSQIKEFEKRGVAITDKVYFIEEPSLDERHVLVRVSDGSVWDVKSSAVPDASAGLGVVWRVMVAANTTGRTPFV